MTIDERIDALWRAYELLQARQTACEFLVVEMIGTRFADMSDDDVKAACERLDRKLTSAPPLWPPVQADESDERWRQLREVTRTVLDHAQQRAIAIAIDEGVRFTMREHSTRERRRVVDIVKAAIESGEFGTPGGTSTK